MLRSDGLLVAVLAVKKHPDFRPGVRETVRTLAGAERGSASSVGKALIRKKLVTPQEFLVFQTAVESARTACRCGRELVLLPAVSARKRRCSRCGAPHTVAALAALSPSSATPGGRRRGRSPSERNPLVPPPVAPTTATPEDSSGKTKRIGRYALLARVGDGGMGTIFKAIDPGSGRMVALKLLRPDASEETKVRFQREAEALARLDHPAVVRVHDVAADERGRRFFTMEFVEGRELREMLPTIPRRTLIELLIKVAEGLHHAHEHGIVHRDVKPHNIIVTASGEPKLADFGLSRDLERTSLTEMGDLVGTPLYMSPEQLRGDPSAIDRRTDVYAVGVLLYEGLSGRLPIEAKSLFDLQQKIARAIPEAPSRHVKDIPRELDRITLRALEKRAEDRYPTCHELARDLRAFLAQAEAPPPPPKGGASGSPRRPRRRFLARFGTPGGLALLGLCATLVGAGALAARRVSQEEERERQKQELQARLDAARATLTTLADQLARGREALKKGNDPGQAADLFRTGLTQARTLVKGLLELTPQDDAAAQALEGIRERSRAALHDLTRDAAETLARLGPAEREEARRLFEELQRARPTDALLLSWLGRLELEDEHLPAAREWLSSALAHDRERADDYWRRGEVYRLLEKPDYALLDYNSAKDRLAKLEDVRPAWVHAGRARALLAQGKPVLAADALREGLQVDAADVEVRLAQVEALLAERELIRALDELAELARDHPGDGRIHRAAAEAWVQAGDLVRAEAELDRAIAGDPSPGAWVARARLRTLSGQDTLATQDLERALGRSRPEDPVRHAARLVQARHLRSQGRLLDAMAALSEDPRLPDPLPAEQQLPVELVGHLLERIEIRLLRGGKEDLAKVQAEVEEALEAQPGDRRGILARAELAFRQGDVGRTRVELERLVLRESQDAQAVTLLALAQQGQKDQAAAVSRRDAARAQRDLLARDPVVPLEPGDPLDDALQALRRGRRWFDLARTAGRAPELPARLSQLGPVKAELLRATRLAPWLIEAHLALVEVLLRMGEHADALSRADQALVVSLAVPELLALRAEALGAVGRTEEALAAWDEALAREAAEASADGARMVGRRERVLRGEWLLLRARTAKLANRATEVRRDLEAALTIVPDLEEALDERQLLRRADGDVEGAEADRRKVELLRRGYQGVCAAALKSAWELHGKGDPRGAVAALEPAFAVTSARRDPIAVGELRYARAYIRLRSGELPQALFDLSEMLLADPQQFLALYEELPASTRGDELERAILQAARTAGPEDVDRDFLGGFLAFVGQEFGRAGNTERAKEGLAAIHRFLARSPGHLAAALLRAALEGALSRPGALRVAREAVEEPGCPAFGQFLAARLLAARGEREAGMAALGQALAGGFVAWERLASDPALVPLRQDQGFPRLVQLSHAAGMLARAERLEANARAHPADRAEALAKASGAASEGLGRLKELLAKPDAQALALAARLHLLRARQAHRLGAPESERELARDLVAAFEASPTLLLEWGQLLEAARVGARLPAGALEGAKAREGEVFPRSLGPALPTLLKALTGASTQDAERARAREHLSRAPLGGTPLALAFEAILLQAGGDLPGAREVARKLSTTEEHRPLGQWLEARALVAAGQLPAAVEALSKALEGGLRGPLDQDPAIRPQAGDPALGALLRTAAERARRQPWEE